MCPHGPLGARTRRVLQGFLAQDPFTVSVWSLETNMDQMDRWDLSDAPGTQGFDALGG